MGRGSDKEVQRTIGWAYSITGKANTKSGGIWAELQGAGVTGRKTIRINVRL